MTNYKNINSLEARQLIEKNKTNPEFEIIDVRTQSEYNENHIENAKLINIYEQDFPLKISKLDKTKQYLVYCRTGNRSTHACQFMNQLGFKNISNLRDGILEWEKQKTTLK